jgi:hypothetical protein
MSDRNRGKTRGRWRTFLYGAQIGKKLKTWQEHYGKDNSQERSTNNEWTDPPINSPPNIHNCW